ncbi:MAG: DNA recombination protein RmuC [Gammaproteobacteria bacterium]|nr:DNA recombination protein RmuC [Gammaproteobacteria bacterium]
MTPITITIIIAITALVLAILAWLFLNKNHSQDNTDLLARLLAEQRQQFSEYQLHSLKTITESLQLSVGDVRAQVTVALNNHSSELSQRVEKLTETADKKLQEITGQVDKRLSEGFEKTTTTFTDVVKRLALIDEAQKKITELSSNVVNLQEVLTDKRARGAFGEIQLSALLHNVLPSENFSLQHTLSNDKRVDCILFLPEPTGNIAIDAKFPLESYQKLANPHLPENERRAAQQQFRLDIRKHIQDIAEKYIIPGETADGAMMFIPAESVFAEIHGNYPDLIEISHCSKVWLVSPTTLMAILTTARAVIKDSATRNQIHIIQEHLITLGKDFERFQSRMDNLTKHISQAQADAEDVNRSAKKISSRFSSIEQVKLVKEDQPQEQLLTE